MAHNLQSMLQNEMPEFDVAAAPGAETATPVNPRDALADSVPLSPGAPPEVSIFAPGGTEAVVTEKSSPITVGALCQTSTLGEAFAFLAFPEELRDPFLNLVGAQESSEASIIAAVPFDVFRESVSADLYLENGEKTDPLSAGQVL